MLFTAFLLMVAGFALMYAGLHSGEIWKHPWSPFVDQLKGKPAPVAPAAGTV